MADKNFATIDDLSVNTIRFLSVDMVQQANSGHPGLPLGASPMAYVLWRRFLRFNPADPHWPNRDRFILSAGHGSTPNRRRDTSAGPECGGSLPRHNPRIATSLGWASAG